nr:MAG TPA: hypothetical protein [Caudoviricetes sp.]
MFSNIFFIEYSRNSLNFSRAICFHPAMSLLPKNLLYKHYLEHR